MAAPVWVLSVDLQTKTATFQTGMADAARSARSAFNDIKESSQDMEDGVRRAAKGTEYSMMEARHGIMMLGEEFGIHLPRGLTMFIASLGPVGAAMEAAFPFLAIILGATLLIEHITKLGEAAAQSAEASQKLTDGMSEGINKATQEIVKSEIEIRKLAGDPAWDLLAQKMELKDAEKGIENVNHLEKSIKELLKAAPATTNWNPLNWGDHSDETKLQAQSLAEQMRGKNQSEQTSVLNNALGIQSKILEQMNGQTDVSEAQLKNQQTYVDFLKQETELIQQQADGAALADQAQQGKDREERIKKAEEEQRKLAEEQQKGFDHRFKIEAEYRKKTAEASKKAITEKEKDAELEAAAGAAVMKEAAQQQNEKAKIAEEAGKEEAEHSKRMAALTLQSSQNLTKDAIKLKKSHSQQILDAEIAGENAEFNAAKAAYDREIATLDKYGKDYEGKLKHLQNKEIELTQEHENKLTVIKTRAEMERNSRILSAEGKMRDELARGLASVLTGHENFGKMMIGIGDQVAAGMLENAIKSIMANDMTKESDAAAAARKAFLAGWHFPWPINVVMAPVLGAMAFASAMAFEAGGIVPGVGKGDVVPAMLTPGEGVLPKPVMDNLKQASNHDTAPKSTQIHQHTHNHNWHAIDGASVDNMLNKHADKFERHVEGHFRKRNM